MAGMMRGPLLDTVRNKTVATKLFSLSGLFAVHKPKGPTSADVLNHLQAKLLEEAGLPKPRRKTKNHILKIGHGGILDSAATGVLDSTSESPGISQPGSGNQIFLKGHNSLGKVPSPCLLWSQSSLVCFGSLATTTEGIYCLKLQKYTTIGQLGKATDTFDSSGKVTEERPYHQITKEDLENVLQKFTGSIMQVPPIYSALKKDGQRLSTLVKRGEVVEAKPARPVIVYSLSLRKFKPPLFTLELSSCASVQELTRTKQGPFTLEEHALYEDKWTIDEIAQSLKHCMLLLSVEPSRKKLKTELSEEHTVSCEDK
ncbi:pseudouridylate synthase TRUB1 isoform X2 [Sphaerodactylus townsendi]|uniref:pseudouridylate synthase TRUB1 isoform X2 n=1 Tax=Sphaerodactylus townsendi TaxID=933632 RepID=UPI002026EB89|nr:pseudouridylate synthase TRUB1 isoform X2 [Sphaerodactylus townsendi]